MKKRFHRGTQTTPQATIHRHPAVHVLNDEQDLREALERAAAFDQRRAEMLATRSAHYRALLAEPADRSAAE